jgi:hypothetical protein
VEKSSRNKNLDAISKRASQPYIVHIQDCSCTCPTYTLSGFPCKHVFFIFSELEIPWPEFFKNSTRFHFDRAYIDKQNQVIESAFLQLPMLPDFSSYYQDLPAANSPEHIVTSSNCEDESPCISPIFKFISETREFAATLNNDGWSIKSIMESSDVSDEKKNEVLSLIPEGQRKIQELKLYIESIKSILLPPMISQPSTTQTLPVGGPDVSIVPEFHSTSRSRKQTRVFPQVIPDDRMVHELIATGQSREMRTSSTIEGSPRISDEQETSETSSQNRNASTSILSGSKRSKKDANKRFQ